MRDTVDHIMHVQNTLGYCSRCQTSHSLQPGNAHHKAHCLMENFERNKSIALHPQHLELPELSTEPLFGDQRGKMFGVLECLNNDGQLIWLHAFSGQYNSRWQVPGWTPPLFDVDQFHWTNDPAEKRIKALTRQIEAETDTQTAAKLKSERTERCRQLMKDIHDLYILNNCCGKSKTLDEVIGSGRNKPTGIGDCCAPKLLNYAAIMRLKPISMAEFYFGRQNRSHSKHHKQFYPPCTDKCEPLLGFLLCGI